MAVALDVVAGHDAERGHAASSPAGERLDDEPEYGSRRFGMGEVVGDAGTAWIEFAGDPVYVVTRLGHRHAHDLGVGSGHRVEHFVRYVGGVEVLDDRADH